MVYKEKKTKFLFCVFVFLFSVKKTFASTIKYRPGTSDTAENVEINQIIRDKWAAALTSHPGKLHSTLFLTKSSEITFTGFFFHKKNKTVFGEISEIVLAGVAASLLEFSANGMKGWNLVNILGELVCIRYQINSKSKYSNISTPMFSCTKKYFQNSFFVSRPVKNQMCDEIIFIFWHCCSN